MVEQISITIEKAVLKKLKAEKKRRDLSLSRLINNLCREALRKEK